MYKIFNLKTVLLYVSLIKNIVFKSKFYVFEKNIKIINSQLNINRNIEELIIPDSVIVICKKSFYNYNMLNKIYFPKSIKRISNGAFMQCYRIKIAYVSYETKISKGSFIRTVRIIRY